MATSKRTPKKLPKNLIEHERSEQKKFENAMKPETMANGLEAALGLPGSGFPFNQGVAGTAQLSQVDTIFINLRYYFVSNFRQVLSEAYCELGLVQTICDVPVDDALRGGIEIKSKQLDEDEIEELNISLERDNDLIKAGQAAKWDRLFGGAGILIMTDQDPETELHLESITEDSPLEFRAVDMWELFWDQQNVEGYDPTVQEENFEFYSYYGTKVHKSRVLPLKGIEAPSFLRPRLRGWGLSVVETLVRSINQYLKATDLAFEVLDEFKLDIFKMKNLVNTLLAPGGEQAIRKRVALANQQKSYNSAMVMDSEDDFDHKQLSFSGLGDAMMQIRMQVAADMRMPITKLFGQSVSPGLGNTDQNDMENYNSMIESQIRSKLKFHLLKIVELKCQKLFGSIPDDISINFKPLRVLSAEQEENVKTQKFNRALQSKSAGEITRFEFRETINKGELLDITLDTAGDALNPDDPDIEALSEGQPEITEADTMESGANAPDTSKPVAAPVDRAEMKKEPKAKGGGNKVPANKVPENKTPENKETTNKEPKNVNTLRNELVRLGMKNSLAYDVAAYAVDGGDAQFAAGREPFFENPEGVDEALWTKAKEASQAAFGKQKWQFITWWYKKEGGKFHNAKPNNRSARNGRHLLEPGAF